MQENIQIKNIKGQLLSAIVEKPEGEGKYPTVLFLHGFKGYKEEATYTDLAERLLEQGIASIRFDASGFGDSEGTLDTDYRFSNYVTDTEMVYQWMLQQDYIEKDKLGVIGQSMGGAQTLIFASKHPEFRVAVAISPPDKVGTDDALGAIKNKWKKDGYLEEMSSRYGRKIRIPYDYLDDAMQYDFSVFAKKISIPLLIVLGEKDDIVSPAQTKRVFDVATGPKTLMKFNDMDHFYKRNKIVLHKVGKNITNFVINYLK
jgi:uncharacterized protein